MNKCSIVSKSELFFAWPFGLAAWLAGSIFISRMQSDRARDILRKAAAHIKSKNIKLCFFPEGTRRNTGVLHPFKKGVFHIAIDAQIPIIPIVYSSHRILLDDDNKRFDSGRIIITTLPPISTVGCTKADLNDIMQQTFNAMNKEFQITSKEMAEEYANARPTIYKPITKWQSTSNTIIDSVQNDDCSIDEYNNPNHQYTYTYYNNSKTQSSG